MTCAHLFLDVGANVGVNARFLYNASAFPQSRIMVPLMDEVFGVRRDHVCYRGFEANPLHRARLEKLQAQFHDRDMQVMNTAVGISNGTVTFYSEKTRSEKKSNFWSFRRHPISGSKGVTLAQINFPEWFDRHVPRDAKVLMKMDIEGTELELLSAMLFRGQLCSGIHTVTIELHYKIGHKFCSGATCKLGPALEDLLPASQRLGCETRFLIVDDEAYHDTAL
jgi:FkbM family methyltransferase